MLQSINIAVTLTATLLSGLLLIASGMGGSPRGPGFRWYYALVLLSLFGAPCDALVFILSGHPGQGVYIAMRILDGIGFLMMGPFILAASRYFDAFISQKARVSRAFLRVQTVLSVLVTALVVAGQFAPLLAVIGRDNVYAKGPLFWLFQALLVAALLGCTALTLRHRRALRRREWVSLVAYSLLPLLCYAAELAIDGLWLAYLGSSAALLLIYLNIQVEMKARLLETEAALAEGRIAMMLSQIQPHFIFNTLTSISEVCADNPLAQKSLITFSEYLRMNMDALTQKTPIPFAQELAHVQQYLWLEKLRFEEKLTIVYDVQADDFVLPVLTLQPVVENAVKHGITRKAGPGTVWIGTRREAQGVRITVRDDGVGLQTGAPQGDGHTGLRNVRARLWELCRGEVAVESTPGAGTIVTLWLPDGGGESL